MPTVGILLHATDNVETFEDVNDIVDPPTLDTQVFGHLADFNDGSIVVAIGRSILEELQETATEHSQGFFLAVFLGWHRKG